MTVTLYEWRTALRELNDVWADLVARRPYNPSLHPQWLDATLTAWGYDTAARVALVGAAGSDVAIIPFLVRTRTVLGVAVRCLELCSNVFAYHAEIPCEGALPHLLHQFLSDGRLPRWDALRIVNVVADSPTAAAVKTFPRRATLSVRGGEVSPYLRIDSSWNDYLKTRTKKVRANITRSQRLMQQAGETGMVWYERGCDPRQLLDSMLEIEARSWKLDAGVAIVRGTPQCAYYERLLPWLAANGILANVLYVKECPVAYTLCAVWQGWAGQLKTSYASELRDAGSRVIDSSLERAFQSGCSEYDFLGEAAPHKMRWTDQVRAHEDLWLFAPHLRGRALGALKTLTDRAHARQQAQRASAAPASAEHSET
jgi:CelD/BcsL family acetyltransferase involved in cellulose biosynthesis